MDECALSTTSSTTFVSAEQSPLDTGSPLIFHTPSPGREYDFLTHSLHSLSKPETSPQQESRTINSTTAKRQSGDDEMPPVTRRQGRLAAQAASSPMQTTEVTQRGRSQSPITRVNILEDASPRSESYAAKLKAAVDKTLESLYMKGRIEDGNAVQELYNQSFKDAGSRVLLDAILRNRTDDRQKRDFNRYVRDVAGLGQGSPQVAGPKRSPESSVLGKRRRRETLATERADSRSDADESLNGGVEIPVITDEIEDIEEPKAADTSEDRDGEQEYAEASSSSKEVREVPASDASHVDQSHGPSKKKRKTRRGRKGRGTARKLGNLRKQDITDALESSEAARRRPDAARLEQRTKLASDAHGKTTRHGHAVTGALETASTSARGASAAKKEKVMFKGANGPVYLGDILGLSS